MKNVKFMIPLGNRYNLTQRIEKEKSKAKRLGVPFPVFSFSEPYIDPRSKKKCEREGIPYSYVVDVILTGEGIDKPVSLGDWNVAARVDHTLKEALVSKLQDDLDSQVLDRLVSNNKSYCHHCQKSIARHNSYILQNIHSGQQISVGGSCLLQYVPMGKNLENIVGFYQYLQDPNFFTDEEEFRERWGDQYIDVHEVNYLTLAAIMTGFVDIKSDDFERTIFLYSHDRPKFNSEIPEDIRTKFIQNVNDARTELEGMKWFVDNMLDNNNEFENNLRIFFETVYVDPRYKNRCKWLAKKYYEHLFPAPEKQSQTSSGNHVGVVGKRYDMALKLVSARSLGMTESYGYYTERSVYHFQDQDNNSLVWFTETRDIEEGKEYQVRATVKAHDVYKDQPQTVITRCNFK